jgi:hypothetical protein
MMRESSAHLFSCFNENVFLFKNKDIMGRVKSYISRNKSELNSSFFETNKKIDECVCKDTETFEKIYNKAIVIQRNIHDSNVFTNKSGPDIVNDVSLSHLRQTYFESFIDSEDNVYGSD